MNHTELVNHVASHNDLFLGSVKIKPTRILTDTLPVISGTVVLVPTDGTAHSA